MSETSTNGDLPTRLPLGVTLKSVTLWTDQRGSLAALEKDSPVPFAPVRTFVIRDVPPDQTRAGHALSCHEFLWILSGSCDATIDDGSIRSTIRMQANQCAMAVMPGVWIELSKFDHGTLLMVLASEPYSETRRFRDPQPDLIREHAQ